MDMITTDYITLAGVAGILAFVWNLHRDMRNLSDRMSTDMRNLSDRVSKLEGLMEGLLHRDAMPGKGNHLR